MASSLLPMNATNLEKHLTNTISKTAQLPVEIDTLWNPQTCPETFLPWFAWALSVDHWNSHWPAQIKRAQIADSIEIHRRKGTVSAVKLAMEAFGVQVELQEWFQHQGQPHTFKVNAWAADRNMAGQAPVLTNEYYLALQKAINNAKPVRSHYDFKAGIKFRNHIHMSALSQMHCVIRVSGEFQ